MNEKKEISNIHKQVYENYSIDKLEEISRSKKETWKNMDKFKKKEIADKILTANMSKSDEEYVIMIDENATVD